MGKLLQNKSVVIGSVSAATMVTLPLVAALIVFLKYDHITEILAILSPLIGMVALLTGGGAVYLLTRQEASVIQIHLRQLKQDWERERDLRQQADETRERLSQELQQDRDRLARAQRLEEELEPLRGEVELLKAQLKEAQDNYRSWAEWAHWLQREVPPSKVDELLWNWTRISPRWRVSAEPQQPRPDSNLHHRTGPEVAASSLESNGYQPARQRYDGPAVAGQPQSRQETAAARPAGNNHHPDEPPVEPALLPPGARPITQRTQHITAKDLHDNSDLET